MDVRGALLGSLVLAGVILFGAACGGPEMGGVSEAQNEAKASGSGEAARSADAASTTAASREASAMETTGAEERGRDEASGSGEGRAKEGRGQAGEGRRRGPSAAVVVVKVEGLVYKPSQVEVPVGATVRWVNEDPADHTVTSEEEGGPLQSRVFGEEGSFEYTFKRSGEFRYFCKVHPFMKGIVLVGR